jgi:hypothetical protein
MGDEFRPCTRLVSATFVHSVAFGGESQSVQIGRNVDSLVPGILSADGSAVGIEKGQRADGIILRQRYYDRVTGRRMIRQDFVPWANIRSLSYGE